VELAQVVAQKEDQLVAVEEDPREHQQVVVKVAQQAWSAGRAERLRVVGVGEHQT